ncbi:MAG TPA: division/cell wall cluster transcriptional repressor MraZ [Gaiellaceae bacterium]|jgi:MraZ protein
MLLGEFDHTIDDKNRLAIPARFRQAFAEGIVVTRGLDGCLYAYTRPDWQRLVDGRLAQIDTLSREGRLIMRHFFSGAAEAELDKQGRVALPAALIGSAKLEKDVTVAGVYDHLEIWSREAWHRHLEEVEGSAEHVAERLAAKRD